MKPPAACARCGAACPVCSALPERYEVLRVRPALDDPAHLREALRALEPPDEGTGAYRRTRVLSEEERDALRAAAEGRSGPYVPGRRPRILPR